MVLDELPWHAASSDARQEPHPARSGYVLKRGSPCPTRCRFLPACQLAPLRSCCWAPLACRSVWCLSRAPSSTQWLCALKRASPCLQALSQVQVPASQASSPFEELLLGSLLGKGSFGSVYRGLHHGRRVAVKVGAGSALPGWRARSPCRWVFSTCLFHSSAGAGRGCLCHCPRHRHCVAAEVRMASHCQGCVHTAQQEGLLTDGSAARCLP